MFNFNDVKEQSFEVLPAGTYVVTTGDAELKDAKTIGNKYVNVKLTVKEGAYKSRVIFARFNIINANPKAESIGRGQLKSFAKACGINVEGPDAKFDDVRILNGKTLIVKTKVVTDSSGEKAEVMGYSGLTMSHPEVKTIPNLAPDSLPF